ncbi:hypothetical protein [Acidithiobacillus ferrooxidans]|uniref:hypothetical protein n=1 Tax=Acidithiobacillus ferrooxidans TaxID=920 RepID=UPI000ABE805D|nr:hypothetical protein [Acidithiobacillus ferrooxidans]
MWKPRTHSIKSGAVTIAVALTLGINLIPAAGAGTLTGGATFPEQIVQEFTALEQYGKNITAAEADLSTQMNTLNQYTADLQNLASMPSEGLSQITMPFQQAMYDYQQATGLMNEYRYMYGNLSNIQNGMAQQQMYMLNSALSPQDYAAAVYQEQGYQAQLNQAQIGSIAASMRAIDQETPIIQQQQATLPAISGNVAGFQQLSAQLTTLEQQNQLMLADIQQAQMQKATSAAATATNISEDNAQNYAEQAGNNYMDQVTASMANSNAQSKAYAQQADAGIQSQQSCIMNGGTLFTCP